MAESNEMNGLSQAYYLLFLSFLTYFFSGCTNDPIRITEPIEINQAQLSEFNLTENEKPAYLGKVTVASSSIISHKPLGECWNGKVLLTNKHIYLHQKPIAKNALEYQSRIEDCGLALTKPEKKWKISFEEISQVDTLNSSAPFYRLYIKNADNLDTSIFIKVVRNENKIFREKLLSGISGNINQVSPSTWSLTLNEVFFSLQARRELLAKSFGCVSLSKKWVEKTKKGMFWIDPVKRPPFWKRTQCITQTGFWSRDKNVASTIYDANENNLLYVGGNAGKNLCGPYTYSWVSSEEIEADVCNGNWLRVDEKNSAVCEQIKIKLRRLAIGNPACYLYGDKMDAFIKNKHPHNLVEINWIYEKR